MRVQIWPPSNLVDFASGNLAKEQCDPQMLAVVRLPVDNIGLARHEPDMPNIASHPQQIMERI